MYKFTSFAIGTDPEVVFCVDINGKMVFVPASKIFETGNGNAFGCDGHSATGECRPQHARDSLGLVANMFLLFNNVRKNKIVQKLITQCGHWKYGKALGGHIHMSGIPFAHQELSDLCDITYHRLSQITEDLKEKEQRLKNSEYGRGYRTKGTTHIEYRSPGSFIKDPQMAYAHFFNAETTAKLWALGKKSLIREELGKVKLEEMTPQIFMNWATHPEVSKITNNDIWVKCLDSIFSNTQDWSEDIMSNWMQGARI